MPTLEKKAVVAEVAEQMKLAKSIFLTDYKGLNVQEMNELRSAFSNVDVKYRVVKNTLAKLSSKEAGCEELSEYFVGPVGLVFGMDDPVAPAKVLKEFTKKNDKLEVMACLFEGAMIGKERVGDLAELPTREQILGQLVGVLQAPIRNLAFSLNGIMSNLVYAINAVKEEKEKNS